MGLRRSWNDERITLSGTYFHVDWIDIQVAGLTPFSAQPITLNSVDSPGLLDGGADAFPRRARPHRSADTPFRR